MTNQKSPPAVSTAHWLLLLCMALCMCLFTGAFYGWGPMQLMLEENGVFSSKCTIDEQANDVICIKQTQTLLNIPLIGASMIGLSPLVGYISDKHGSSVTLGIMTASCLSGIGLWWVSSRSGIDELLFLSFCLIALSTTSALTFMVQVGLVFQEGDHRRRAITLLNLVFDAGAVTYLGLYEFSKLFKKNPFETVSLIYLGLGVLCFVSAILSWRAVIRNINRECEKSKPHKQKHEQRLSASNVAVDDTMLSSISNENNNNEQDIPTKIPTKKHCKTRVKKSDDVSNNATNNAGGTYVVVSNRNFADQLKSGQFITLVLFLAVHHARSNFVAITARNFLSFLGDDDTGNKYLFLFQLLNPVSIFALPLYDFIGRKGGFYASFQTINILGICHGIIQLSSNNLNVQVFGFIMYSMYRGILYGTVYSYVPVLLAGNIVGKGVGLLSLTSAMFALINLPLVNVANKSFDGDFFWANMFYTVLLMPPCVYLTWRMGQVMKLEQEGLNNLSAQTKRRLSCTEIKLTKRLSIVSTPVTEGNGDDPEGKNRRLSNLAFNVDSTSALLFELLELEEQEDEQESSDVDKYCDNEVN